MNRHARFLAATVLLSAACTDADGPLSPANSGPAPEPVLQALECSVGIGDDAMRCGAAQPGTGAASGSGSVVLGGQDVFVRLASSGVRFDDGTLRLDVTVQNLIDQPLGTADGETEHARGVRVWFDDGPIAHPGGAASVANADGEEILVAAPQPYFQYDTVLARGEVSTPRRWEMAYTPGTQRISFTVYVVAQVQHRGERLVMPAGYTFVLPGDTVRIDGGLRDFIGRPTGGRVAWSSSDPSILSIDSTGLATGHRRGGVWISARAEGGEEASAPAAVVNESEAVRAEASIEADTLDMGERRQLSVTLYNLRGEVLEGPAGWSYRHINVALVDLNGLVRATYPGTTQIYTGRDWAQDSVLITTRPGPEVAWATVRNGVDHTCGVTTDGRGFCWGHNGKGQLGIGAVTNNGEWVPVGVDGEHEWTYVDGGLVFSCGLDTEGRALCWGEQWNGKLGNGVNNDGTALPRPVPVRGGLRFTTLSTGDEHACGLTAEGAAWCWGNNTYGQLGNDTTRVVLGEAEPVAVVGGHRFREIRAGRDYTCAITTADALYCWGNNEVGQLADGASAPALNVPRPVAAAGGHRWRTVATSGSHACGLTTAGRAYCWGQDQRGELGTGVAGASSSVPVPVALNLTFIGIGTGGSHSCAVAVGGDAYCWGYDYFGQLGRGEKESHAPNPTPEKVIGGVRFTGPIDGGSERTCALAEGGRAYCWGGDAFGAAGVQPDVEFCWYPGGQAACQTRPRPVTHPAPGGVRTGPGAGFSFAPAPGSVSLPGRLPGGSR